MGERGEYENYSIYVIYIYIYHICIYTLLLTAFVVGAAVLEVANELAELWSELAALDALAEFSNSLVLLVENGGKGVECEPGENIWENTEYNS